MLLTNFYSILCSQCNIFLPLHLTLVSFLLLSACTDEIMLKITDEDQVISSTEYKYILPNPLPSDNEKLLCASNPKPYLKY